MTPLLILVFGFDPKAAVGTDILHGAIFKSFGAARHRMLGTVHARLSLWMLLGSAPMSLLGVELASRFGDGADSAFQRLVGAALIVCGLGYLAKRRSSGGSRATTRRSSSGAATAPRPSRSAPRAGSSSA